VTKPAAGRGIAAVIWQRCARIGAIARQVVNAVREIDGGLPDRQVFEAIVFHGFPRLAQDDDYVSDLEIDDTAWRARNSNVGKLRFEI
jgi:hypothetical protein